GSWVRTVELAENPVLLTHATARGVVAMPRNKSDDLIRAVAASGGTIGVSIYGPMCWDGNPAHKPCLDDFLRHLDHIVNLVGVNSVTFGTDLPAVKGLRSVDHILEMTRTRFPENIAAYEQAFGGGARQRCLREIGSPVDFPQPARGAKSASERARGHYPQCDQAELAGCRHVRHRVGVSYRQAQRPRA